ncbi:hypothetical protein ACM9HF_02960 [Colwellia sp. RE-S-Sl-9]
MSVNSQEVKFSLSSDEFRFILNNQLANKSLSTKLLSIKNELLAKRSNFKRVTIISNLADLDGLLVNLSKEANKNNNSLDKQYFLDNIFGKL